MVDLETIEREINELEARGDTTYALCERLAWLYVVRDHLRPTAEGSRTTQRMEGSEFLEAAGGVPFSQLMMILDEHMEAVKTVQPKAYSEVIAKIRLLSDNSNIF